jgi:DNA-binding phage protein
MSESRQALQSDLLAALRHIGPATIARLHTRVAAPRALTLSETAAALRDACRDGLVRRRFDGVIMLFEAQDDRDESPLRRAIADVLKRSPAQAATVLAEALSDVDPVLVDELAELLGRRRRAQVA